MLFCSSMHTILCVCCVSGKLFHLTTVIIIIIIMLARFVICETALAKHWIHKQKKIVSICRHGQTAHNSMIHKHTYKFRIINCHRRQANCNNNNSNNNDNIHSVKIRVSMQHRQKKKIFLQVFFTFSCSALSFVFRCLHSSQTYSFTFFPPFSASRTFFSIFS